MCFEVQKNTFGVCLHSMEMTISCEICAAHSRGRRIPLGKHIDLRVRKKSGDKNRNLDAKLLVKGSDQIHLHELYLPKEAELVIFFFFFADL